MHGDAWAAAARLYGGVQAIDCGADGVGVEREGGREAGGGVVARPPTAYWDRGAGAGGQSGGSQRIVLPSQPVCNLSHSRNRW